MTHANAPLTPTGRLRMVHRHLHDGIYAATAALDGPSEREVVTEATALGAIYADHLNAIEGVSS